MKKLFLLLLIPFLWFSCQGDKPDNTPDSGITVSLNKDNLTLTLGKIEKLTAKVVNPADSKDKAVTWSTSNESIVTVTDGTITAVAEGTVTIKAASKTDTTKTAQCAITVIPRPVTQLGPKNSLSGKTAAQFLEDNYVYAGWNLGNAFDGGSGYGDWTRKIDKNFLPKVKEAGFSMIRIPVTWNSNIGAAPGYTINATMLDELVQVVDWAYEAGLVTIINIHHDGAQRQGVAFNASTTSWLSILRLKQSQTELDTAIVKFTKVWEQIAERFKDYGDWLIFEPFNELHNGNWGNQFAEAESNIINKLNQTFSDTVRAKGGKNAQRFLVVQPLCAKPKRALDEEFKLPTEKFPADTAGKQIVSMHYYEPENFALNGNNNATKWGNTSDKVAMSTAFESYAEKFTKNGIPIILGECGATYQNRTDTAQKLEAAASRILYMDYMASEARANGIIPVYWDNGTIWAITVGENFGLWDRRKDGGTLNVIQGMNDIINAIINGVWK
jgi:endoglucanase